MSDDLTSLGHLTIKDIDNSSISGIWNNLAPPWEEGCWRRVRDCRRAQKGEQLWNLGEDFDLDGTRGIRLRLPQITQLPLQIRNVMEKRLPFLRRYADSPSPRDQSISSNVEGWVNSAMKQVTSWPKLVGRLLEDGAVAGVVVPATAHWSAYPTFLDTIDEVRWKRLTDYSQERYAAQNDGTYVKTDKGGDPVPRKIYWRDKQNRAPDNKYYKSNPNIKFKRNEGKTRQAYEDALKAALARRPPFKVRLLSITDCIPEHGPGGELRALIVRSSYTRQHLERASYVWDDPADGLDASDAVIQTGTEGRYRQSSGDMTMLEYWGYDLDGTPFVAYSVEGMSNTRFQSTDGKERPAVINLLEEYGITRLPAIYQTGLSLENGDDYPSMPMPFLSPILDAATMVEAFLSAKAAHAIQHGFTSWMIQPDAEIIKLMPDLMLEGNKPRTYPIKPMQAFVGPGIPHALVAPVASNDVNDTIRTLMGMITSFGPSGTAFGGPGATSGHDRSLTKDYMETAMAQIYNGALAVWQFIGEMLLEQACGITDLYDINVPIFAQTQVPQVGLRPRTSGTPPKVKELDPSWLHGLYDLDPILPDDPMENIAVINLFSQLYKDGLITWEEFRGNIGDESPENSRVNLWVDQQINTDDGKALVAAQANEIMGANLQDQIKKLVDQGLMTPDGEPTQSLVDPDEIKALQHLAARRQARALLSGSGPEGHAVPAIPSTSPAAVEGLMSAPPGPVPGGPGSVPANTFTPRGVPQGGIVPGAPNNGHNIGTGVPYLPNSILGGVIAGSSEAASMRRDEMARHDMGL